MSTLIVSPCCHLGSGVSVGHTLADLSGAELSGADLSGAELSSAELSGADLSGAELFRGESVGADIGKRGAEIYGLLVWLISIGFYGSGRAKHRFADFLFAFFLSP